MRFPWSSEEEIPEPSGKPPGTVSAWCLAHRRLRLTTPRAPDRGCSECEGRLCRYCQSLRLFSPVDYKGRAIELPPDGVCDRRECRARAKEDERTRVAEEELAATVDFRRRARG